MGAQIERRRHVHADHPGRRQSSQPTTHRVIGDRIVAATWGIAAAMTRGDVRVHGVNPKHLALVLDKLRAAGADRSPGEPDGFRVVQAERPRAVNFSTLPYPGFPTDLQPMAIGLGRRSRTEPR